MGMKKIARHTWLFSFTDVAFLLLLVWTQLARLNTAGTPVAEMQLPAPAVVKNPELVPLKTEKDYRQVLIEKHSDKPYRITHIIGGNEASRSEPVDFAGLGRRSPVGSRRKEGLAAPGGRAAPGILQQRSLAGGGAGQQAVERKGNRGGPPGAERSEAMSRLMRMAYGHSGTRLKRVPVAASPVAPAADPRWLKLLFLAVWIVVPLLVCRFSLPTITHMTTVIDTSRLEILPAPVIPRRP